MIQVINPSKKRFILIDILITQVKSFHGMLTKTRGRCWIEVFQTYCAEPFLSLLNVLFPTRDRVHSISIVSSNAAINRAT